MSLQPVNWKIVSHPINWIVILLMLVIAATFGHLVLSFFETEPSVSSYSDLPAGQRNQTESETAKP